MLRPVVCIFIYIEWDVRIEGEKDPLFFHNEYSSVLQVYLSSYFPFTSHKVDFDPYN